MELQPFYFNLSDEKKESVLGFLVESVLKSRIELGMKEDPHHSDEDVNIYLAFLLLEASYPSFNERIRHLASLRNTDVFKMVEDSQDNYFKYLVYKTNADHLLLLLSIFKNLGGEGRGESAFFEKSQSAYEGYAKTYYQFASEYDRLLHRKVTALGIILSKLSHFFNQYQQILLNVREAYLNFLKTQEENFTRFLKDLDSFEGVLRLREIQDLFLDTYSAYLKTGDALLQEKLFEIAQQIKKRDPSFKMPALQ
ncbi:MAG: hypothetical protein HY590_05970 [Candidatus Omnitrophica bacterium]|nr:hypothetical protein [Candidatus Omnitrophota bacterium]